MTISDQLLFFDTFSHEAADIIQLDLVQFPRAVQVSQIRVIPLGARVKADFPGGVRLGATNPSSFEIEFFINDLSKRGAATFENVGKLQYSQHGSIHLEFEKKPPTDGLLLRGNYNTITLAVYGNHTKVQREPTPPKSDMRTDVVPQPPPEKVNTHERIRHWLEDTKRKQHVYEINPSEEEHPEWEAKTRQSPSEFEVAKPWDAGTDIVPRDVSEKDKRSYHRSLSREKSWDRTERLMRKDNKKERHSERNSSRGSRDLSIEKDKLHTRTMSRERFEDDDNQSMKKSVDDWEEKRSEDLGSLRQPRTPLEPTEPQSDSHLSPYTKEDDRTLDTSRGSNALPPPILSDDMEAISDDEELPDLPPPETLDFPETTLEDEEAEAPQNDEVIEENENFEYEQILSDEDDLPEYQYEEDYIIEEWEDWVKPFIAQDVQELPKLGYFTCPTTTDYEKELSIWNKEGSKVEDYEDKQTLALKLATLVSETSLPGYSISQSTEGGEEIPEENGETWVQAVEQVCQILPSALVYAENSQEILQKLSDWAECGLDIDMALNQKQPVFKIRHMKVGIRLTSILVQIKPSIATRSILDKLFSLNKQSHLALSIRLQIIKTLDGIISSNEGLRTFVYDKSEDSKTCYEILLEFLSTNKQSRAKMALAAVSRKINFLEICEKLYFDCLSLMNFINQNEMNHKKSSQLQVAKIKTEDVEMKDDCQNKEEPCSEVPMEIFSTPPELLNSIDSCLKEISRIFLYADQLLVQPNKCLPGSKTFQLPKHNQSPLFSVFNVLETTKILESIASLLVTPSLCQNSSLCGSVKHFLQLLMTSEQGIRFLAWQRKATMMLIKALQLYGDESRETQYDTLTFYNLGVQLCAMMHTLYQLDCLALLQKNGSVKRKKIEDDEVPYDLSQAVIHLHSLESLLMSSMGREAIVGVLGLPPFFHVLLPYLQDDDPDSNLTKIACFGYAVDLLSTVVKYQDNATFLEEFASKINSLIPVDIPVDGPKFDEVTKLMELQPWISVAKEPEVFGYDMLSNLVTVVQESLEKLDKFPGELVTSLRILSYLTIPKISSEEFASPDNELVEELKFKYATIQLFSAHLHTHIVNMFSKLFVVYQQPFIHSSNFSGPEGGLVVSLLKPSLALLKNILDQIIQARNTDFKDLTAVIPLVQMYILLQAFPSSSQHYSTAQELQQTVISVLLSYTQVVYTTEGEDVLSKSLWTQMMAEVFKYLMNAPHTMVYVINLITELLPLPLPIETHNSLSKEESDYAVRVRKLWSAHLYSLAPTFQEVTHRLGLATHPSLTHSLRRMCVTLSDLSAPMALLVAKATLDLVLQTHRLDQRALTKDDSKIKEELPNKVGVMQASQQTVRALNMLASLVSHAPTKAAVLHLLRGGSTTLSHTPSKSEDKFATLVQTWCCILCQPIKATAHMAAQECLITIIDYLVDYENAMQVDFSEGKPLSYSGVPPKEILVPFIEALFEVIRNPCSSSSMIHDSLLVLSKLLEHNIGFYYVKSVIDVKKGSLHSVLRTLINSFSKNGCDETIVLLQETLNFAQFLMTPFEERTGYVSVSELATYFGWKLDSSESVNAKQSVVEKTDGDDVKMEESFEEEQVKKEEPVFVLSIDRNHPLHVIENLVVTEVVDEETMENLYEEISRLVALFEKETTSTFEATQVEEPVAVGGDSIQGLFADRIIWKHPSFDDDLHSLWLLAPNLEELPHRDGVSVNLIDTARKYTPDFDLLATLHKLIKGQASHFGSPQKLAKVTPKYKPSATAIRPDRRGKPYVAPMRGRSFGRAINVRSDPFRSRPPNTSRPPSLHVDDFVALESTGHQPTGPTGYNKISFGRGKIMLDSMRGTSRGRTRGESRGSRFFHRPPFRGEGSRVLGGRGSGPRRGTGWVFRGEGSQRGNFRGNSQMPPRFLRGRPFSRGSGGGGNPKDRFSQKFERGGRHIRGGFR